MRYLIYSFVLLFAGCATENSIQKLNPAVYYKNDICFSYEKPSASGKKGFIRTFFRNRKPRVFKREENKERITFCGVGVLPFQDSYKIRIDSGAKINLFSLTTCHREITTENPDKGIFKKDGVVHITYNPTVEKGKACPLFVSAFNKQGKHAWGVIALEHPRFGLAAEVRCNGDRYSANGVSICQAREGLIQEISFLEEVKIVDAVNGSADRVKACPELTSKDGRNFTFTTPPRECIYGFIGKTSRMIHKLYTVGYEEFIVRE